MTENLPAPLLFAGPSLHGLPAHLWQEAGVALRPPARRGDVQACVAQASQPGVLLICDGAFQQVAAVGHAELCTALDAGWQVWGVSSLGAIRAYELRGEGMRGFGEVHAMFSRFEDFTDDELCLLHFPQAPWFPLTEALVNVRHALSQRGPALGLAPQAAQRVIEALRGLWFGDRTVERLRKLLVEAGGLGAAGADDLLSWLARNRLKTEDLRQLLNQRPWRESRG